MLTVIKIENLYKEYRLGIIGHGTLYRDLQSGWAKLRGMPDPNSLLDVANPNKGKDRILALKDINLDVKDGEILGIIGANGAGKSTLLKILSRVTAPTSGTIKYKGKVASLLEVGTGFHRELTGRENIYLNGAINGMNRREVNRKLDEIVDFASVEKFLDTPVKRYSSGMFVRLGFAVAAHLDPDILAVDEVLAVGDASFQKKAINKMQDVSKGEGRTVLFVSHNMNSIERLCNRVILLSQGEIIDDGDASEVVRSYLGKTLLNAKTEQIWDDKETAPGNNMARLRKVCVRPENSSSDEIIDVTTPIVLEFEYWNLTPDARMNLSLAIYNEDGVFVINTGPFHEPVWHGKKFPTGLFKSTCHIPGKLLNNGKYSVTMSIVVDARAIFTRESVLSFEVHDSYKMRGTGGWQGKWAGVVRPDLQWNTKKVE